MGLDISYYSNLVFVRDFDPEKDNYDYRRKETHLWDNESFPGHINPFKNGVYTFDKSGGFRAGSYSGYYYWRCRLFELANGISAKVVWDNEDVVVEEKYKAMPFYDLIQFSDCEGTIGTEKSKKLLEEFKKMGKTVKSRIGGEDERFWYLYKMWRRAFFVASKNGAVRFH